MARQLRGCFAGRLVEVTSKTVQGRFLLRPSREVTATLKGVIARAQDRTAMKIVAAVAMSNHVHFFLLPKSTLQLTQFMEYFMSNAARKVGRLYGWKGSVWARRYKPIIVSHEEEAQVARLAYILGHGVKEGLVRQPQDWPGLNVVSELLGGQTRVHGGEWHDRSAEYRAELAGHTPKKGEFVERGLDFELTTLPCWQDLDLRDRRSMVRSMVNQIIEAARVSRDEAPVLGVQKILRQDPRSAPETQKASPAPRCHAASRKARLELRAELKAFADAFLSASRKLREGAEAAFPLGCFPPRLPYLPEQSVH